MSDELKQNREHQRFRKQCTIDYKVLDSADSPAKGCSKDISGGGICLHSTEQIADGQTLALRITVPGIEQPLLAIGIVKWSKPAPGGGYQAGVFFWLIGRETDSGQDQRLQQVKQLLDEGVLSSEF